MIIYVITDNKRYTNTRFIDYNIHYYIKYGNSCVLCIKIRNYLDSTIVVEITELRVVVVGITE